MKPGDCHVELALAAVARVAPVLMIGSDEIATLTPMDVALLTEMGCTASMFAHLAQLTKTPKLLLTVNFTAGTVTIDPP